MTAWRRLTQPVRQGLDAYRQLEERERLALALLGCFLLGLCCYFYVWQPAYRFLQSAREFHADRAALVSYMKSTRDELRHLRYQSEQPAGYSSESLLTLVTSAAGEVGLQPDRMQPAGEGSIDIQFDEVAFSRFVTWLHSVNRDLEVQRVLVDRQEASGMVRARVLMQVRQP